MSAGTGADAAARLCFEDIEIGRSASFESHVSADDIDRFADLSGDRSPLHVDDAYARTTELGGRVVHGMLLGALLSRLVGMHLPGRYALYLSQSLEFVAPVRPGDDLTVSGEVIAKADAVRSITLRTEVRRGAEIVVRGRAIVKVLR